MKRLSLVAAFLFALIPCHAQIALVNSTAMPSAVLATGGTVTTTAVSMTGATSIWCGVTYAKSTNSFVVSDSKSNTWHSTTAANSKSGMGVQWFYTYGPVTSSSQTFTLTSTGSTTRGAIGCYGLSGTLTTSGVLDPSSPTDSVSASSGGTTIQPGSLTPALSGEAFLTLAGNNNIGYTYTISSPFNTPVNGGSSWNGAISYYISTGTSAEDPTWTVSSHDFLASSMVAVAPSGGSCPASAPVPTIASCSYNLNFGSQAVGSASSAQTLSFSIAAGTVVGSIAVLTTGIASKDFANAAGSTCTASTYTTATNCVVNVSLTPLAAGPRRGAIVFYSGANNTGTVLAAVPVYGVGNAPQVAYGPGGAQSSVGSGFSSPDGVAVDGAGNVFIADATAGVVDKVTPGGTQTTVGGGFSKPVGVAVDGAGNVYVTDFNAAAVYQVTPGGTQVKVGSGFIAPAGVAVDGAGNVYVVDPGVPGVYKVTPGGTQTKLGSGFIEPAGVAVDGAGNVYVVDSGVPGVYKITPGGVQTTVSSGFSKPVGVAVDAAGSVYIVDAGADTLYEVTPGGTQTTVGSGFASPAGLAVDGSGNLYITDTGNVRVVKIDRADAPSLSFAPTNVGSTSSDSPKTVEIQNIGNLALTLTGLGYPADFPGATGDNNACTSTTSLSPAEQCDLPIDFTPQSEASLSEDVTLTDNALNVTGATQSIAVSGTGTSGLATQTITFTPPVSPVTYGVSPIMLSATGGGSGNPVVFSILSGPGSIAGSTLTISGVGTVVVAANQAGNASYTAAAQVTQSIVIKPASQTITFTPPTSPVVFGVSPITLSATGGASGNAVTFSVISGPGSVSGSTLTITGVGTVVAAANQAGNANYTAAAQVTQSIVVNQDPQTITFTPPTSPVTYGSGSQSPPTFTLVQKCHAKSNTSNTCTFANNVTPGDLVIGGAVIDNTEQSTGVKDGAGNVFTLSPNSPCTGGSVTSHGWLFYLLSSPGGAKTNTVLFTDTGAPFPNDYVDEIWAYEFVVSGGTPVFDTDTNGCGLSTSSANPAATLTLSGSNELAYFAGYLVGGKTTGVGSPWTLGTLGTAAGVDGFDTTASSSITTAVTPAGDGWGIVMAMAIKAVPAGSIALSAAGGASGNPVTFSVLSGPGSVSGNNLTITGVGAVVVAANQAGNANYTAAAQVTQSVVVTQASQTIAFTPPTSPVTYGVSPITLSATGGASGNPVIFSVLSGPGSISGNTLTITGVGTVVVAANQAGNANYAAAAQVTQSVIVNQATLISQTITFTPPTSPVIFGVSPIALSATGGASGNPVIFSVLSGPGSISGNTLTITGAGTVVVAANQAGNASYAAAAQVTQSITVNQASQTITFTPPASPVVFGVSPMTLSATGGASGNAVTFTVVSGPGSITGSTLTITGVGTVVVAANQAGNANYTAAAQVTQSITVNQASQTIAFTPPTSPVAFGVSPITLNATGGGSGNAVTFSVLSGPGTVSGSRLTITGVGTVVVAANQAGNANYTAAAQVTQSITVNQASQTITFTPPTSPVAFGVSPITLSATGGGSGNAVTFSVVSGPGSVSGSTLTITGVGAVVVAANQAGNANYTAAAQVTQSVTVNQGSQTIAFTPPTSPVTYGVSPLTLSATGGASGNPVIFSVLSGPGSISGNTLTITGVGTVVVAANQAGNANYAAAAQVTQSVIVNQATLISQTITFTPPTSPVTYGVSPIALSATGGASGNPVIFSVLSGPGSISGNTLTITGAGSVVVAANQAGNASYAAAAQVTQSITVNQASQTITFTPPASPVAFGVSPMTLSATGGASGNAVTFTVVSGPGSIAGSTLTITGVGTVVVAANQAGNANYTAAAQVTQSVVVNQASQSIAFTPPPSPVTYGVSPITLSATGGGSGNPVIFSILSGPGSIAGSTLTITGVGAVVVAANQAGNANYTAAAQVTQSITVNQTSQTVTFTPPVSPVTYGVSPITLGATGGGSGNPVIFSILSGPGSIAGSTLTIAGVGTVVVAANQAGNANYTAAAQVTQSVVVNQASQSIAFTPPSSPVTYGVSPITLSATGGGSGNPVIFSVLSGPGSITGNTLTITGVGTVVVAANQAGNANYAAAAQVTQSVIVNPATLLSQTITFTPPPSPVTYGVPPITLSATGGGSGNPVIFSILSGPGSITGNTLTITGVGTVVVAANQAGNASYAAAAQVTQSVTVNQASTITTSVVQHAFAGDASGCNEHLTCTLSTTVGNTKLSQAIGSGHLLLLTIVGEGTNNFPVPGTPVCNSSGCGTWVHLSGGNTGNSYCANQFQIQTGHHFFTDCWAVYSTTSGSTSLTVPFTDPGGGSDVTNMDLFLIELGCSGACTHNTLDAQASVQLASSDCTSCAGPALTLSGSNDVVMQVACFQENYASVGSPYTIEDVDTNSANAVAYRLDTSSGTAATWGQSPTGGGIYGAYAISIAP